MTKQELVVKILQLEADKKQLEDKLKSAECNIGNITELSETVRQEFINPDGGLVKADFKTVIKFLQIFWDKVKETALECNSVKIEVKFKGFWNGFVKSALSLVGLKL